MDSSSSTDRQSRSKRTSYSMSNLMLFIALIAIGLAWWVDRNRVVIPRYDIPGPLTVSYTIQTSPNSTSGGRIVGVIGIDIREDQVIVHTSKGGSVMSSSKLVHFSWQSE